MQQQEATCPSFLTHQAGKNNSFQTNIILKSLCTKIARRTCHSFSVKKQTHDSCWAQSYDKQWIKGFKFQARHNNCAC